MMTKKRAWIKDGKDWVYYDVDTGVVLETIGPAQIQTKIVTAIVGSGTRRATLGRYVSIDHAKKAVEEHYKRLEFDEVVKEALHKAREDEQRNREMMAALLPPDAIKLPNGYNETEPKKKRFWSGWL